jgi:site-specific DNA-methyltransferase (adenine-specific)
MSFTIHIGDCRDVLRLLPDASVDSVVTDPPYELGFMGKSWDRSGISNDVVMWREVLRVLKPGGHLLAFGGSRTYHRMACAIEDAGFELRDQIMWLYGSGFPKSLDVSKAIDRAANADRPGTGKIVRSGCRAGRASEELVGSKSIEAAKWKEVTIPATDAARQWEGWGTALKPAHEPICVARKPLHGNVAANVLEHGTGAINIDQCRIPVDDAAYSLNCSGDRGHYGTPAIDRSGSTDIRAGGGSAAAGRWPANVIHDGSDEVLKAFAQFGERGALAPVKGTEPSNATKSVFGHINRSAENPFHADAGTAARFFYCAKASRADRNEGCEHLARKPLYWSDGDQNPGSFQSDGTDRSSANNHPTVKPTDLMRWLCRLVTPPGGLVLDPFMGSGSTGRAAIAEGFRFAGIERDPVYAEIARCRISAIQPGLSFGAIA